MRTAACIRALRLPFQVEGTTPKPDHETPLPFPLRPSPPAPHNRLPPRSQFIGVMARITIVMLSIIFCLILTLRANPGVLYASGSAQTVTEIVTEEQNAAVTESQNIIFLACPKATTTEITVTVTRLQTTTFLDCPTATTTDFTVTLTEFEVVTFLTPAYSCPATITQEITVTVTEFLTITKNCPTASLIETTAAEVPATPTPAEMVSLPATSVDVGKCVGDSFLAFQYWQLFPVLFAFGVIHLASIYLSQVLVEKVKVERVRVELEKAKVQLEKEGLNTEAAW
ncbi:hypothetical protein BDZ91DRAFT_802464 [Kalaharituber pfeilii]|nr:hypothetical protein BDZ91DRAFT_802464 [Kalaharituber pfeilii]